MARAVRVWKSRARGWGIPGFFGHGSVASQDVSGFHPGQEEIQLGNGFYLPSGLGESLTETHRPLPLQKECPLECLRVLLCRLSTYLLP